MKKGLIWCLWGISIFFVLSGNVLAADPEEIVIAFFYGGYPPFYMEGLEEGMIIDFLKEFDEQSPEFTITFEPLSRKRVDLAMEQGEAQASGLTNPLFVGEKQAANSVFTEPIWTTGNYIILHKDNLFEYKTPEDLFGKRLGVIYGNKNAGIDPHIETGRIKAMPVSTNEGLYKALQGNKVDAIIANNHVFLYELKLAGIDSSQFIISKPPVSEFGLMTQVQKTHQHFCDKLNDFIEESRQNGFLEKVTQKYLE